MIADADRVRGDRFLLLPHYPLFGVTVETVKSNFRWREMGLA